MCFRHQHVLCDWQRHQHCRRCGNVHGTRLAIAPQQVDNEQVLLSRAWLNEMMMGGHSQHASGGYITCTTITTFSPYALQEQSP